ncbi:MAG: uroporphyrinogen decarboxylase family protein [Verrucomicrobiota bacterium]
MNLTDHAAKLVARTRAAGGLAPVDLARFWSDQDRAFANPFGSDIPQVPLGVLMSRECIFAELDIPETPDNWYRLLHDAAWAAQVSRAYNDKAEQIVGRRLLSETSPDPQRAYPLIKQLHDIFEAKNVWHNESYWLQQSAHGETELQQLLDLVEQRLENLRRFLLPPNWDAEKHRLTALGVPVPTYRFQRGPVTFATSIYGAEDFVFLILDNPDLAVRFRDVMIRAMLKIARILDDEAGQSPRGFQFNDDNCCLLTAEMYELFAYPILKTMFDRSAPAPGDRRYQHSDSAMGHLLPVLARLNFTGVNFGPTLPVTLIREHMPGTIIDGQLAPFTFSRNEEENIVCEFLRDFEQARAQRGLCFSTAGSINNGSRLTGMRLIMAAIQEYGRYA